MSAEFSAETAIKQPMPEIFTEVPLASDQLDSPDAPPLSRSAFDKLRSTRLGQALAVGSAALALAGGEALNADKADASQTAKPNGSIVKVVNIKAQSVGFSNKLEKCFAAAEKEEQPAPPVDPYARCEGKVKVRVIAKAVAKCKPGWMGGRAAARASVRENIHVLAWSEAIASGRAEAKAKTRIRDKVKTKASARVNCVKVPDENPQIPPTTPNVPPEQPPLTPPPVFPPPEQENRPPTTDMTGPEHVFENGQVRICTQNFDPDGDNLDTDFDAVRGTTSFEFPHPTAPNVVCTNYTAPPTEGTDTVTVEVTDGQASDSDSETFPIVDDNF